MPKRAERAVPQGMNTVTLYLSYKSNCIEAIELYKNAFEAKVQFEPMRFPDGRVLHAMIKIGDSNIMMSDSFEKRDQTIGNMAQMWIYVEDCDSMFNRAVKAGCKVAMEMEDQFWGDRVGQVHDPFGYLWSIASTKWDLSAQEMQEKQQEWLKSSGLKRGG